MTDGPDSTWYANLVIDPAKVREGALAFLPERPDLWHAVESIARRDAARQRVADLIPAATRFSFGTIGGPNAQEEIDVELRPGLNENSQPVHRWAVICYDWTYSRHGRWTYARDDRWMPEPIPSYRDQDYLDAHRFDTLEEAITVARQLLAEGHPYAGPWTRRRLDT